MCSDYFADLIQKKELCLIVVSVLLKIRFGHSQISVLKIDVPILKTDYINLWSIEIMRQSGSKVIKKEATETCLIQNNNYKA